jgi:hypothetical protein
MEIFSETENKLIKLLGAKKLTIKELTEEHFKGKRKPLNSGTLVSGAINRINKKCEYHKLQWFINGVGIGRGGKTIWKDKLPRREQ